MTKDRMLEIQERAYVLWELECCPEGRALDHWLCAEAEFQDEPEGDGEKETAGADERGAERPPRAQK